MLSGLATATAAVCICEVCKPDAAYAATGPVVSGYPGYTSSNDVYANTNDAGSPMGNTPYYGERAQASIKGKSWGYGPSSGDSPPGEQSWGGQCNSGGQQSPIDIPLLGVDRNRTRSMINRWGLTPGCTITNGGHGTMQVNLPVDTNITEISGRRLQLLQFHFHTPSEHRFDGRRFSMEAHMVHRDMDTGGYVVLSTMMRQTRGAPSNPALRQALDNAPMPGRTHDGVFNPLDLLPPQPVKPDGAPNTSKYNERTWISYTGSLTTPPCDQPVQWCIFTEPIPVAADDVMDFIQFAGNGSPGFNARPLQPINGREVTVIGPRGPVE